VGSALASLALLFSPEPIARAALFCSRGDNLRSARRNQQRESVMSSARRNQQRESVMSSARRNQQRESVMSGASQIRPRDHVD